MYPKSDGYNKLTLKVQTKSNSQPLGERVKRKSTRQPRNRDFHSIHHHPHSRHPLKKSLTELRDRISTYWLYKILEEKELKRGRFVTQQQILYSSKRGHTNHCCRKSCSDLSLPTYQAAKITTKAASASYITQFDQFIIYSSYFLLTSWMAFWISTKTWTSVSWIAS